MNGEKSPPARRLGRNIKFTMNLTLSTSEISSDEKNQKEKILHSESDDDDAWCRSRSPYDKNRRELGSPFGCWYADAKSNKWKGKNLSENLVLSMGSKSVPCQTENLFFSFFFFFSLFAPHEKFSIRPESPPISSNRRRRDPSTCYVKKWLSLSHFPISMGEFFFVKIIKKRTHNFSACHGLMIAIIKKVDDFRNKKRKWKARQSLSRADERGLHDKRKLTFDRSQKKVFPLSLTPPCSWKVLIKCCVNFIFGRDFLFGWGRPLFSVVCEKLKLQLRS